MRTILILISTAILIAFANGQRKSNFTKPIINLDKRPRPPVWNRPPEERRKLSIFPKTNMKFVVTPKPVVKNEDLKETLPTKRPIMRKFVMQDKNEKGTWSFAPREPLMKAKRFTVTLAPRIDKSNVNAIDELKPEESKKVKTVVELPKAAGESSMRHKLNKGNLIETVQSKKVNSTVTKGLEKFEQKKMEETISELMNDTHSIINTEAIDNNTFLISDTISKDYVKDERNQNDTKFEENINYQSITITTIETTPTPDTDVTSEDLKESRVLDTNDTDLFKYQYGNSNIIIHNKETSNERIEQFQSLNGLEMLKNNTNDTEKFYMNTNVKINDSIITPINEDILQLNDSQITSNYYEKENINNSSVQHFQSTFNNDIKNDQNFTGSTLDSGIVSDLENLMQLIEEETHDIKNDVLYLDNTDAHKQIESFMVNKTEIGIDTVEDSPTTNNPVKKDVSDNFMENISDKLQSEESGEQSSVFIDIDSEESFENKSLSSAEISTESLLDEDTKDTSNESTSGHSNLTAEEISSDSNNITDEDISNESIRDASNNYTEKLTSEFLIDKSSNLTGEEVSNESSSDMTDEELSNESNVDKNNDSTEETSNASLNETSNDSHISQEEISQESGVGSDEWLSNDSSEGSGNVSEEDISDEALANRFKRSNNIIVEENLATTVSGFKYKGQETRLNHDMSYKNINA